MASGGSYEVLGTADIPKGDWSNIAIKAKKITVSSDSTLDHVILLAEDEIDIGSNVVVTNSAFLSGFNSGEGLLKFGSDMIVGGPCDPVLNFAGYATGKLTVQSDTTFTNVQLATSYFQDVFDLQSDNVYVGVAIQSTGDVNLGSDNQFSGCPDGGGGGPETGPDAGLYVRLVE